MQPAAIAAIVVRRSGAAIGQVLRRLQRQPLTRIPYLRALTLGTAAVFFAVAITVAAAFPIHASDALTYGEWSRLIAQTGHFEFKSVANVYNRPLFYFLEGWVWRGLGFSNTSGRLLCGLFSVLFLLSLAWLVGRRAWGRVAVALAVLFALATPVFA